MAPAPPSHIDVGFGGRLQILGVELYDCQIAVNWRLAPLPDAEAQFATEPAAHDEESAGLPEEDRRILRARLVQQLSHRRGPVIGATDDAGTEFQPRGGGAGGGPDERVGRVVLVPAPAPGARRLAVTWQGDPVCTVPLPSS